MQVAAFKTVKPLIAPQITGLTRTNNNFVIEFSTVLDQTYTVQSADDLVEGGWSPLAENISGTGKVMRVTDTNAAGQFSRFYRVRSPN